MDVNPFAVKTEAVIFDMDGVIVDSEPRHERAFLEVVREIGFENHGLRFSNYIGRCDTELWLDFIERNRPPYTLQELLLRKRNRMVDIIGREKPLFDGLPGLIQKLSASYKLALASGSERAVISAVLAIDGLAQRFSAVVSSSEVPRGKPAPDIFLRTAELLGCPPEFCVVIEDSKPGIAAAHAAGMRVIAITNTHPASELSHATKVVSNYEEIERLLVPRAHLGN